MLARFTPLVRLRAFTRSSRRRRASGSMKYLPNMSRNLEMEYYIGVPGSNFLLLSTETRFHEFGAAAVRETVH